jgi:hypothetical protein
MMTELKQKEFFERIQRYNDAIALKEPDHVPICPNLGILPYALDGCTNRDAMYNYPRAMEAILNFYKRYPMMDAAMHQPFNSGKANELAGSTMIDWPGRPGTKVPDLSTYQVMEFEYMKEDEYEEILQDFTGFMLRKYIPRAYPNLAGLASIQFIPAIMLGTIPLGGLFTSDALKAYEVLGEIAKAEAECARANTECSQKVTELGIPPYFTGGGEVPFDVIGDYYRSTLPTLMDQLEHEDEMEELCYRIADMEIASFQYFRGLDLPVKRANFPMHKGMDGFMSAKQYEKLYWKPFKKIINALIDMDVTPYLYTEGKYNSRLEQLTDLPKGKCMIHFEQVDIRQAKKIVGGNSCIVGNFPMIMLEMGTPEQVTEKVKELLDICMPGGGYIFDCDGSIDIAKEENLDAMFEALVKYGNY